MTYRCLNDKISFKFVEELGNGIFRNKTDWGFQIVNPTHDVKMPRWGLVNKIGPEVKDIKEGDYILIEPLMWTLKMNFENEEFWTTSQAKVLARASELPNGIV